MESKAIQVGDRLWIGTVYGAREVEVVWCSESTVEFRWVGKIDTEHMSREVFAHKVAK